MRSVLIDAIRTGDPDVMQLFAEPFNHRNKWVAYLEEYFTGPDDSLTVNTILDLEERWHSRRFQALYVACWIYRPVEKGSYMIRLNEQQTENAVRSAEKLTWRLSSHLSGTSRSARGGSDLQFIRGYGELLVLIQDNYLFLKMEGHAASSPAHLSSWATKWRTGAGNTANPHLHALSQNPQWGILERGAENYSKTYKALLKALGFSGKTTTFAQVIARLGEVVDVDVPNGGGPLALRGYLNQLYLRVSTNPGLQQSPLHRALMGARADLYGIVDDLERDNIRMPLHGGANHLGLERVYREIRLAPERIDSRLNKFYRAVQAADFNAVRLINNS